MRTITRYHPIINQYIKRYVKKSVWLSGAYNVTKKLNKGATILFYHGVEEKISNPVVQERHISMDQFEKQMYYLKKNFEVISIDYLYECISKGYKIDHSHVLLTFDDGYKNNYHTVAPFLKTLNMPFTVFISTKYIDKNDNLRMPYYYVQIAIYYTEQQKIDIPSIQKKYHIDNEQMRISTLNAVLDTMKTVSLETGNKIVNDVMKLLPSDRWSELNSFFSSEGFMCWDEVQALNGSGVTIGSHCHDHAILHSGQSNPEVDYQLKTSKDLIEKHLGICNYFAYPNGRMQDISYYSINSLKKNKYLLGFTTVPGEVEGGVNPFIIPRLFPYKDMDSFKFTLNTSFRHNDNYSRWCSGF